jgi:hypothetical protein
MMRFDCRLAPALGRLAGGTGRAQLERAAVAAAGLAHGGTDDRQELFVGYMIRDTSSSTS